MSAILYLIIGFAGYAMGRVGHMMGGHLKAPHHWIYGAVLVIGGVFFWSHWIGIVAVVFGIGLFISDLKDFTQGKWYGVDDPGPKRFWGID